MQGTVLSATLALLIIVLMALRVRWLTRMAYTDSLTNLPNRAALTRQLRKAVSTASRNSRLTAVIFFDLDNFKQINDQLGHAIGDQVLTAVARQLAAGMRAGDHVARLGGDEFIVIANNLRHPSDAHHVYQRLSQLVNRTHEIAGRDIQIAASAGIAVLSRTVATPQQLLSHADEALYRAKAAGNGAMRIASSALS